ncbi:Uncharacterized protein HZ326_28038 [Fusarium oxysporum f. sp. albedinis]|nr:Uncharacterized protein HZ326_28038 [Fusarium oxysporum f. sp. albedinis]
MYLYSNGSQAAFLLEVRISSLKSCFAAYINIGGFHGSSCLDEDFRKYMERLLAEETYLEQGVEAMNWMVEEAILRFKVSVKPNFHCDQNIKKQFYIPRLRDNEKKGFKEACVHVDRSEIEEMFTKQLDAIFEIIKSQLNDARGLGYKVEKIVLIGGFGRSRFLIDFLKERVAKYSQEGGSPVALLPLEESTRIPDIVTSGAVLLAMNQPPVAKAKGHFSRNRHGIVHFVPCPYLNTIARSVSATSVICDVYIWTSVKKLQKRPPTCKDLERSQRFVQPPSFSTAWFPPGLLIMAHMMSGKQSPGFGVANEGSG